MASDGAASPDGPVPHCAQRSVTWEELAFIDADHVAALCCIERLSKALRYSGRQGIDGIHTFPVDFHLARDRRNPNTIVCREFVCSFSISYVFEILQDNTSEGKDA